MKSVETELLESLAGGVRLFDVDPAQTPGVGTDFDALLADAKIGNPNTTLDVRFGPEVSGMFDQIEQRSIARSVDRAAIAGIGHALILHGQRTLRVDVRNRVVLEATPLTEDRVIDGIEGFVASKLSTEPTSQGDEPGAIGHTFAPARVVRNASLVHSLAGGAAQSEIIRSF